MDAERGTTVDDLVASAKPAPPPPDTDTDDEVVAEAEPINGQQLLVVLAGGTGVAVLFGLWLIVWWLPLLVLALAGLAALAWFGKLPGLKGGSQRLGGTGKAGWPLGRSRGSSGLLGGGTGRSGGRGAGKSGRAAARDLLGGKGPTSTKQPGTTLRQRAAKAAGRARNAARKVGARAADKARAAAHRATGGRLGKPSSTGGKGSTSGPSGSGSSGGSGGSSGGGKATGKDTAKPKRKRRSPLTVLGDLVTGRKTDPATTPATGKDKPTKPKKKPKKRPDGSDTETGDETTKDDDAGDEPAHTAPGDTDDKPGKDKPGLLGRYGRLAHAVGDRVRSVDPKAVKAALKDALVTPFKGLTERKPKAEGEAAETDPKTPAAEPPKEKPTAPKPPPTYDDNPPPPSDDGPPAPPQRYLDDDPPELPAEPDQVPKPRRPPSYDDTVFPPRHVAYRKPREIPTYDDWIDPDSSSSGTRAHTPAAAPTEKTRRSTTMTVTATGAPVVNGSGEHSTPDSRSRRWNAMADGEEANARVFALKADEFQQTLDVLKGQENQTLATEESIREATEGKAEAEAQAQAFTAAALTLRNKAQEELSQKSR